MICGEQFDNIIRLNFGGHAVVTECEVEGAPNDWSGFADEWVSAFGLPDEPSQDEFSHDATIAAHLREYVRPVIEWAINHEVADELVEYWGFDEFMPALAEIFMLRVMESHYDGVYCNGTVGQQSIALFDWGRIAGAFIEANEGRCER